MALAKVGNKAPAFNLFNQRGEKVRLSSFAGEKNVVVYFYPKAMTPGCTVQACGIRDFKSEFDLLSDEDHAIAEKYGVWDLKKFMGKEFMGILRTTFIVGKDGKIKHVIDKVKTKTHHDDVLAILAELP